MPIPDSPDRSADYVAFTAAVLQERCTTNRPFETQTRSLFQSSRVPPISIMDYLKRIIKYSQCSPQCLVIMLIYLDRYTEASGVPLCFRNVHRLVITAIMVAAKLRDDIYFSNAYYSSIGGVTNSELNFLEVELLNTISWQTWVEPSEFTAYETDLYGRFAPASLHR